jgi:hypothetical protein
MCGAKVPMRRAKAPICGAKVLICGAKVLICGAKALIHHARGPSRSSRALIRSASAAIDGLGPPPNTLVALMDTPEPGGKSGRGLVCVWGVTCMVVVAQGSNHAARLLKAATMPPGVDPIPNAPTKTPSGLEDSATSPVGNGGGKNVNSPPPVTAWAPPCGRPSRASSRTPSPGRKTGPP